MTYLVVALLLGVAGAPAGDDGIAVAKRITAAIEGHAEFHDSDFVRPLEASDKAALRGFAPCKVEEITHTLMADPTERDTYMSNPNEVLVRFGCRGVPSSTPVGITLELRNGRIETVATHNADLMRVKQWPAKRRISKGQVLADTTAVLSALDIVFGGVDR